MSHSEMHEKRHFHLKMSLFMQHYLMDSSQISKLKRFGVFTLKQAKAVGVEQPTLSRLVKKGFIQRVGRGLYLHPKTKMPLDTVDFQMACAKFGAESAIGGLSALFHYNLTDQAPNQIWVIVPSEKKSKEKLYRPIRTKSKSKAGILVKDGYRITDIERTLVEALKLSSKIGERTAIGAIRTAISKKMTNEVKIGKMAKALGLESVFRRYFEVIVA